MVLAIIVVMELITDMVVIMEIVIAVVIVTTDVKIKFKKTLQHISVRGSFDFKQIIN